MTEREGPGAHLPAWACRHSVAPLARCLCTLSSEGSPRVTHTSCAPRLRTKCTRSWLLVISH